MSKKELTKQELDKVMETIKNAEGVTGAVLITPDMTGEEVKLMLEKLKAKENTEN